jgi:hypothetical protein
MFPILIQTKGGKMAEPFISTEQIFSGSTDDTAARKDQLGFGPYVRALGRFLTSESTHPPLVISIEGRWGSGKSSFMHQLQSDLESRGHVLTVWFNPWRHDKEESLWAAFALQFLSEVRKKQKSIVQRSIGDLRLLVSRYNWKDGWFDLAKKVFVIGAIFSTLVAIGIVLWLQGNDIISWINEKLTSDQAAQEKLKETLDLWLKAGGITAYFAVIFSLLNRFKDVIGSSLKIDLDKFIESPDYGSRISFIERFHADFGKIVNAYGGKQPVYVFIDDLDRCDVPHAADLMSAINLLISNDDTAQIIFIVGMDREKIAAGLAVKYEKLMPFMSVFHPHNREQTVNTSFNGIEYGFDFIEKFIQIPFVLPRPEIAQIDTYLRTLSHFSPKQDWFQQLSTLMHLGINDLRTFGRRFFRSKDTKNNSISPNNEIGPTRNETIVEGKPKVRHENFVIEVGNADSDRIIEVAKALASSLESNPRRLKQFMNLMRLRTLIASETGLFDTEEDAVSNLLTPEQLGKFIALEMRWHLFVAEIEKQPMLLAELQNYANNPNDAKNIASCWQSYPDLIALLATGKDRSEWDLSQVNIKSLLRVSPQVRTIDFGIRKIESKKTIEVVNKLQITSKVFVIEFRPAGIPKSWNNTESLVQKYIEAMQQNSANMLVYQVVNKLTVDNYPVLEDGRQYTDDTWKATMADDTKALRDSNGSYMLADYQRIIQDFNLVEQVKNGEIDEVWMFGGPYFGFYESRMVGKGAFWCNGPSIELNCRRFVIMGYNYERGVKEMVHDFGHRAESILARIFGSLAFLQQLYSPKSPSAAILPAPQNDFEEFLMTHGTIHRRPGGADYNQDETAWVTALRPEWFPPVVDPNKA